MTETVRKLSVPPTTKATMNADAATDAHSIVTVFLKYFIVCLKDNTRIFNFYESILT